MFFKILECLEDAVEVLIEFTLTNSIVIGLCTKIAVEMNWSPSNSAVLNTTYPLGSRHRLGVDLL